MPELIATPHRGRVSGDRYSRQLAEASSGTIDAETAGETALHPLDRAEARAEHRRLLEWYYMERDIQAENRLEMAMDADCYDGFQWHPEDSEVLRGRGQMPLVYNEVAPMIDWLIGTERRTRVDWSVLPRTDDDVQAADIKTKVLKYVSDINRVAFARSRAFADAMKSGVGWVDDGARDDPTQDVLYSRYEDWRNVLHDSSSYELDLSDARYLFRWRWVDEDVALASFPDRREAIQRGMVDYWSHTQGDAEEFTWYLGERMRRDHGLIFASSTGGPAFDAKRRRIKLIEAQYRKPVRAQVIAEGPLRGQFFDPRDGIMAHHVRSSGVELIDRVAMRMHVAVFTEGAMLSQGLSAYRHNRFSLTPIWCYRRGRDRLPYGAIRRVRDIQFDLNKRASKAQFLLNTNQILAEEGATDDWQALRDEADRPDGMLVTKPGKRMELRRDAESATGQIQLMELGAASIQRSAGVNNENLGRQTNAVSGAAIEARQNQGSVGTTEPFDNLRLAIQVQGEKQLSLTEQFYSDAKVVRLTGAKQNVEWVRINQPEMQPDGSVRYLNDITASMADFVVAEADYAGTMRDLMFDHLAKMAQSGLDPNVSLRLLTIAMQFSDLPNKDEVAAEIRAITGARDPDKEMTPEEAQQAQEQMQAQAEALQMQRELAQTALAEQQAKVREINARAQKLEAEAAAGGGGAAAETQALVARVRQEAADQIDALAAELRRAQSELANRTLQIGREADTKVETARIEGDAKVRVAEIQQASDRRLQAIEERMTKLFDGLAQRIDEVRAEAKAAEPPAAPANEGKGG